MAKKKPEPRKYSKEATKNVEKILSYANGVLGKSSHESHKLACEELFGVSYMHPSMEETRSCLSHTVGIIREQRKAKAFFEFIVDHMEERLKELQSALHPEDEEHLVLQID